MIALTATLSAKEKSSPAPRPRAGKSGLAPYEERLRNARTVKVRTDVLGIELETHIDEAQAKLNPISEGGKPTKDELQKKGERGSRRVLWQLTESDFSSVYVKTNGVGRITTLTGFLREGKEIPFEEIGDVRKAPVRAANGIAWDVVRPEQPLFRVVAQGAEGKARSVSVFVVKPDTAAEHRRSSQPAKESVSP